MGATNMAELREIVADLSRATGELRKSTGELRESQAETDRVLKRFIGSVGSEWGLRKFKKAFPQYEGYMVYGAVAAIKYDAGLERLAAKRGLFVFQPSGEIMKLANEKGFKPKGY